MGRVYKAVSILRIFSAILSAVFCVSSARASNELGEKRGLTPFKTPIQLLWGQQIVGADIAKYEMKSLPTERVRVVVSDGPIYKGAQTKIRTSIPEIPKRKIKLSLLSSTAKDEAQKNWLRKLAERVNPLPPIEITVTEDTFKAPPPPTHAAHVAGLIGALGSEFGVSNVVDIDSLDLWNGWSLDGNQERAEEHEKIGFKDLLNREEKTQLINMSHWLSNSPEVVSTLKRLIERDDTLCTIAAGNDGRELSKKSAMAQLSDCVVVGAYGTSGVSTFFSNFGDAMDIIAPGEAILSRGRGIKVDGDELQVMSGTSMAAPIVNGTLANLRALLPKAHSADLRKILYKTAIDLGLPGKDPMNGYGLLNTLRATMVAARLVRAGTLEAEAVTNALTVESVYDLSEYARQAKIEGDKLRSTPAYSYFLRKLVLLRGQAGDLKPLGDYYISTGLKNYGEGLQFAAINIPNLSVQTDEVDAVAKAAIENQRIRHKTFSDDLSIFQSIVNVDLLFSFYTQMPDDMLPLTPYFLDRVQYLDAARVPQMEIMIKTREDALKSKLEKEAKLKEPQAEVEPTQKTAESEANGLTASLRMEQ